MCKEPVSKDPQKFKFKKQKLEVIENQNPPVPPQFIGQDFSKKILVEDEHSNSSVSVSDGNQSNQENSDSQVSQNDLELTVQSLPLGQLSSTFSDSRLDANQESHDSFSMFSGHSASWQEGRTEDDPPMQQDRRIDEESRGTSLPSDQHFQSLLQEPIVATLVQDPSLPSVQESTNDTTNAVAVEATLLQDRVPWWKQRSAIFVCTSFFLAVTLAVVITLLISAGNESKFGNSPNSNIIDSSVPSVGPTPVPSSFSTASPSQTSDRRQNSTMPSILISVSPSLAPSFVTSSPTQFSIDCVSSVTFREKIFRCSNCYPHVAVDDNLAVITDDDSIYFYTFNNDIWEKSQDFFIGTSTWMPVAMSGNVVVVGAGLEHNGTGAVYVFDRNGTNGMWNQMFRLLPDDIDIGERFGWSVDVDGDVMVVGALEDRDGAGSAYVYRLINSTWTQETKLAPVDSNLDFFGVFTSIQGNTIAVSDINYGKNDTGAVFIYKYDPLDKSWIQSQETIVNNDCDGWFGSTTTFTQEGMMLIGCSQEARWAGAVYSYKLSQEGESFSFQQNILFSDNSPFDLLGGRGQVSVDGNIMVAGTNKNSNGALYIFTQNEDTWTEVTQVDAPVESSYFGVRVVISRDQLFISALEYVYLYSLEKC